MQKSPDLLSHSYLILLDDLDLHWSASPTHRALLEGLLEALLELSKLRPFSFVVSLRRDIFAQLTIADRDKLRHGLIDIEWTEDQLRKMLEARIGWALYGNISQGKMDDLFDTGTWKPICAVAGGNPRRAIEIAERAIVGALQGGRAKVTRQFVDAAISRSSSEFLMDLADQYHFTYPGLHEAAFAFRGFRAEFSFDDFEGICAGLAENVSEESNRKWILQLDDNALAMARVLLDVRFLLYKSGRQSTCEEFNESRHPLDRNCWLAVNPAYRPALGIS